MGSRWRAALVFIGLVVAFGYPLVNGLTHLSHQLPLYISSAEHGRGRIGHLLCRFHLQAWVAGEINRSLTGYALGNLLTSLIAGVVVFTTLAALGVPFPLLWALWVALVDFLPMIGGALAGIPTVFFAAGHSLTAGIVTLIVFMTYTQVENHVLNPVVMSRTAKVNPLLILVSLLVGTTIGQWLGGTFGAFVAALVAIPLAGALQVIVRELWQATASSSAMSQHVEDG